MFVFLQRGTWICGSHIDRNELPVEWNTVGLGGGSGIYWIKVKEYEELVYHSGKVDVNRRSKPRTKHKVNIKKHKIQI